MAKRAFFFSRCEGCEPCTECAQKLFGAIETLRVIGDKVAVITAEAMREDLAAEIASKLSDCKTYRLL